MSEAEAFHDTNILLYLVSADAAKADVAEALIAGGGHVSVQVLNEFASIATRKFGMTWAAVADVLEVVRNVCRVHPLSPRRTMGRARSRSGTATPFMMRRLSRRP